MRLTLVVNILYALAAVTIDASPSNLFRPGTLRHVVHEEIIPVRRTWTKVRRMPSSSKIPVRIGLTQENLHRAQDFIRDVAHPRSVNYGRHWSVEEVVEMFKPSKNSVDAVMEWLALEGISPSRVKLSVSKTWLEFNASVQEVELLLKTEYHVYKHEFLQGGVHVACDRYYVPEHLVDHVDIITPTVHFNQRQAYDQKKKYTHMPEKVVEELKKRSARLNNRQQSVTTIAGKIPDGINPKKGADVENAMMNLDQCDTMITPDCLRALYKMPIGSLASKGNTLGIVEYTPQAFLQSDLDMFFGEFQPYLRGISPEVALLDNAVVQTANQSFSYNGESALDLEFAMALIYPQHATLYQVGDLVQGASFNNFLDGIDSSYCNFEGGDSKDPDIDGQYAASVNCGTARPTHVISTSYGTNEADLSPRYERRQCDEYMKLALQGVTVVYSSGDDGVAGNDGQCLGTSGKQFNPSFPGGCPWVTSVGATQVRNGSSVRTAEVACEEVIFSGGGFSNVFEMPSYQSDAVLEYLENFVPAQYGADQYNNSGVVRAFPDLAVNGANYVTTVNGKFSLSYGTSASAPVFAAMITMINELRIQQGKGPVGFVNEALYAHPEVMNDIMIGNNPGCGTNGFSAAPGWDPLTGLGTPNFEKMQALFLNLP